MLDLQQPRQPSIGGKLLSPGAEEETEAQATKLLVLLALCTALSTQKF